MFNNYDHNSNATHHVYITKQLCTIYGGSFQITKCVVNLAFFIRIRGHLVSLLHELRDWVHNKTRLHVIHWQKLYEFQIK